MNLTVKQCEIHEVVYIWDNFVCVNGIFVKPALSLCKIYFIVSNEHRNRNY